MYNAKHHYYGLWQFTDDPVINNSSINNSINNSKMHFNDYQWISRKMTITSNDDENTAKFANNCTDRNKIMSVHFISYLTSFFKKKKKKQWNYDRRTMQQIPFLPDKISLEKKDLSRAMKCKTLLIWCEDHFCNNKIGHSRKQIKYRMLNNTRFVCEFEK